MCALLQMQSIDIVIKNYTKWASYNTLYFFKSWVSQLITDYFVCQTDLLNFKNM
jgi:hypothetical protein